VFLHSLDRVLTNRPQTSVRIDFIARVRCQWQWDGVIGSSVPDPDLCDRQLPRNEIAEPFHLVNKSPRFS
jgi:hypothetical protein